MNATRHKAGFSLIEVMIAILILGIGLVGLTHGITTALGSSKESELQTTAALLAAGRIELLRADGFLEEGLEQGDCGKALSLYRWRQSVTATTIDGLYEVAVVVEHSQTEKPIYELRTLLFDAPFFSSEETTSARQGSARSRQRESRRQ